eukprot:TRINITY_DN6333_c0_g1_i1.p2 TRINITY_DN6333_c0_g1~~TRINITY_DN6333_c0_g1_i1.p2  ORF type:complete len:135 (-),score=53.93 TRINITY_DN6333_c0_g1_i1:116-520(-)
MSRSAPPPHHRAAAASLNSLAAPHTRLCVMEETVVKGVREGIIEEKGLLDLSRMLSVVFLVVETAVERVVETEVEEEVEMVEDKEGTEAIVVVVVAVVEDANLYQNSNAQQQTNKFAPTNPRRAAKLSQDRNAQ